MNGDGRCRSLGSIGRGLSWIFLLDLEWELVTGRKMEMGSVVFYSLGVFVTDIYDAS